MAAPLTLKASLILDAKKFKQGSREARASMQNLGVGAKGAAKNIAKTGNASDDLQTKLNNTGRQADKMRGDLAGMGRGLGQAVAGFKGLGSGVGALSGPLAGMGNNISTTHAGLLGLSAAATGVGVAVAGMAAAFTAGLKALDSVDEMQAFARTAGVTAQSFQELNYITQQYRINQDDLADGLKELALRADEMVETGAGPAFEAFNRLGYSAADLRVGLKDTDRLFMDVIKRLEGLDNAAQIRIADEVFGGTAGERFVRLLDEGAEGIKKAREEFKKSGALLSNEAVAEAAKYRREITAISAEIKGNLTKAFISIAPAIVGATRLLLSFIDKVRDLAKWAKGGNTADYSAYSTEELKKKLTDLKNEKTTVQEENVRGRPNKINKIQREIVAINDLLAARKALALTPISTSQTQEIAIDYSAREALEAQKKRLDQQAALLGNEDAFLQKIALNKAAEERRLKILSLSNKAAQDFNQANEKAIKQGDIKAKQASDYHDISTKIVLLEKFIAKQAKRINAEKAKRNKLAEENKQKAKAASDLIKGMLESVDGQNEALRLQIKGQKEMIPLLKLEADLKKLGVSLSEKERNAIEASLATQENLTQELAKKEAIQQAATAQVEAWSNLWNNAASQIEDALGDSFEKIIRGGKVSFEDFANSLTNIFAKLASDIAQQLIFQPMIKNVMGDLGLSTNPNLFGPAMQHGTQTSASGGFFGNPLVSTATKFASGFGGNFAANALMGDRGPMANMGGTIGGFLGGLGKVTSTLSSTLGIAGSFAGPLGIALGAFGGNILGGLFGRRKKRNRATVAGGIDPNSGILHIDYSRSTGNGDRKAGEDFLREMEKYTKALAKEGVKLAGRVNYDNHEGTRLYVGTNHSRFQLNPNSKESLDNVVAKILMGLINPSINDQIGHSARQGRLGNTPEQIFENINFLKNIDTLFTESNQKTSPITDELKALNATIETSRKRVRDLSLTQAEITKLDTRANAAMARAKQSIIDNFTNAADAMTYGVDAGAFINDIKRMDDTVADLGQNGLDSTAYLSHAWQMFDAQIKNATLPQLTHLLSRLSQVGGASGRMAEAIGKITAKMEEVRVAGNQTILRDILGHENQVAGQFYDLVKAQEVRRENAISHGLDTRLLERRDHLELERFLSSQLQQTRQKEITAIDSTINALSGLQQRARTALFDLQYGGLSLESPKAKFDDLLNKFRELAPQAQQGDRKAIEELLQVNQALSQARQAYYATSDAAIAIYDEQKDVLNKIDLGTDDALAVAREQLDALQQQNQKIAQGFTTNAALLAHILDEIKAGELSVPSGIKESQFLAAGGRVVGPGTNLSDSIPAWLSSGEFVISANAAKQFGYQQLERINRHGHAPLTLVQSPLNNARAPSQTSSEASQGMNELIALIQVLLMGQKRQISHLENLFRETEEGNADRRRLSNGGRL